MKRLLMVITLFLALGAYAADYYVSSAGSDSNPGTQAQPFASIQHAIDVVPLWDGATIHLDGSTWNGSLNAVDKAITLIGDYNGPNGMGGRNRSIINGSITCGRFAYPYNVPVWIYSLNIQGIVCSNYESSYTPNSIIEDCDISNPLGNGILAGNYMTVRNCSVHDCSGYGIRGWKGISIYNNTVYNNNRSGIYTGSSVGGNSVSLNTAFNNNGDGIYVNNDSASGNTCFNNRGNGISGLGCGMGGSGPLSVSIGSNYCYENDLDGIYLAGTCSASGNHCYNNTGNGISYNQLLYYVSFSITNNTIGNGSSEPGNAGSGLIIDDSTTSGSYPYECDLIDNNTIIGNGHYGMAFNNTCVAERVTKNIVQNNGSYGIYLTGANCTPDLGGGALSSTGGNTISGNGTYDLYKTGTNNVYAKYNHWDTATEAQMAGGNQKKTNITRFYDAFDYWQPGNPLSGAFIWSSGFPKNGKLEFTAKNKSHVQPASLGKLKAAYAR